MGLSCIDVRENSSKGDRDLAARHDYAWRDGAGSLKSEEPDDVDGTIPLSFPLFSKPPV